MTAAKIPAGYAERNREDDGAERQLEGRRKQFQKLAKHRPLGDDRRAEVARHNATQIIRVLDHQRPIVAELMHDQSVPLRRHDALAGHELDRIAGEQADKRKRDDCDPKKRRDQDCEPSEQEAEHDVRWMLIGRSLAGLSKKRPGGAGALSSSKPIRRYRRPRSCGCRAGSSYSR